MPDPVPPKEPIREQPRVKTETAERTPLRSAIQTRLVTPDGPLAPELQDGIAAFIQREYKLRDEIRQQQGHRSEEGKRAWAASISHNHSWAEFRDELGMNTSPDFTPRLVSDEGVITVSTDPQTGEVTGFSTALVKDNIVVTDYVGTDSREDFRGRNLGIRLIAIRNLALAKIGIQTYETNLGPESLRMYEKSGLTMESLAELPSEEGRRPRSYTSGINHKMTIDMDELSKLCQELGIDPQQDPFTTTQQLSL